MKKLFLMIVSAICGVLPFSKANASASTCTYTYSDGTTTSQTSLSCRCDPTHNGKKVTNCTKKMSDREYEHEYDASGNIIEEINYSCNNGSCQISSKSNYQYNKSGKYERVYTNYDSSGNILDFTKSYYGHGDLWFVYDSQGQLIRGYDDVMMSGQCGCPTYSGPCGCDFSCDNNGCFYANGDEMGNYRFQTVSNINTPSYFDGNDIYTCPNNAISCYYDEDYGEVVS